MTKTHDRKLWSERHKPFEERKSNMSISIERNLKDGFVESCGKLKVNPSRILNAYITRYVSEFNRNKSKPGSKIYKKLQEIAASENLNN